ncbi:hypothetical protein DEJ39_01460 [Bacteroidetes bacterium SCGC AAA795-G10]|nr:hypothetical protein DEJ39_01460 [Bacteroidetes bacterium SCGC AAA795-G10]
MSINAQNWPIIKKDNLMLKTLNLIKTILGLNKFYALCLFIPKYFNEFEILEKDSFSEIFS